MDYRGIVFSVLLLAGWFLSSMANDYRKIDCIVRLDDLEGYTHSTNKEVFKLFCPPGCERYSYWVGGSGPYVPSSSICRAAVHSGKLGSKGGRVRIETIKGFVPAFNEASTRNGVESEGADWAYSEGFKVLDIETSTTTVMSSVKANTSNHPSYSSSTEPVSYSPSQASVVEPTSSLLTVKLTSLKTASGATARSTKSTTLTFFQHNTKTQRSTQNAHLGEGANDIMEVPKSNPTLKLESSTTMRVVSNASLLSGVKVTGGVVVTNNMFDKTVEKVSLVLMFVVGVVFAMACMILRKKRKNIWIHWRRKRQRRNCDSKDDETLCVCYQTLDASTQGLLYDPDTCVRSCTKKQQETQDFNLQTKPSLKKQEICYEGECRDKCSGNCNPEMFEF